LVQVEDLPAELRSRDPTEPAGNPGGVPESVLMTMTAPSPAAIGVSWKELLRQEVTRALTNDPAGPADGRMNQWSREFETAVLGVALKHTRGRRMEAAQLLGIGRNTMTRKIAELHLEDDR